MAGGTCLLCLNASYAPGMYVYYNKFVIIPGEKRMKNLLKGFEQNGLVPRIHGNSHRTPTNALSFETVKDVVSFLLNYVELNGVLLPGRVLGYSRTDIKLLPSSTSKRGIWRVYRQAKLVMLCLLLPTQPFVVCGESYYHQLF